MASRQARRAAERGRGAAPPSGARDATAESVASTRAFLARPGPPPTPALLCARLCDAAACDFGGEGVSMLLAAGAPVDALDRGRPPLGWAAKAGNGEAVRALLQAGADASAVNADGTCPLMKALLQLARHDLRPQARAPLHRDVRPLLSSDRRLPLKHA
jgi:hypothetical protein